MCEPITLAGLALSAAATAGGNYLQTKANNKSLEAQTNARNNAAAYGVAQQQPNIQKGQDELNQTLQKFSGENQADSLGKLVASRTAAIGDNSGVSAGVTNPMSNITADTPQVVKSDLASRLSDATGFAAQQAAALGRMGATADQFSNNNIALGNNSQDLTDLNNKAVQEANVNRLKQTSDASNARKSPSTLGELLSTAGAVGGMAASNGAFSGSSAAVPTVLAGAKSAGGAAAKAGASLWSPGVLARNAGGLF